MKIRPIAIAIAALSLGGCASFSQDGGFNLVESTVKARIGKDVRWIKTDADADAVRELVKQLLASPLSADDAVQVALLNNRGLQATYAELGIAEADLVQAGRMTNPHFAYLRTRHGGERKLEWALTFPVIDLLTMPLRTRLEENRFEEAKLSVAGRAVDVGLETRRAWYQAVAAAQTVRYMEQVKEAAETSAELARRMAAVGNWPRLNQQREQVFYAETTAQLARVMQAQVASRERLSRLLGLWGDDLRFRLPDRLPELPKSPREAGDLETQALAQRLDVQGARRETEALAESMGLTRVSRFVNLLDLGLHRNSDAPKPVQKGWELELRIPIFDFGEARVVRAEQVYMQSVNRTADLAIRARSEVREAYAAYRTTFDLARHYRDEIVPLRKRISEEMLLRYNGMLASVFELLADSRDSVASVNAYIEAQRDFWLAESDLQAALTAGSPGAMAGGAKSMAQPAAQAAGH